MARVILGRGRAEAGDLPPICLRCGLPATVYTSKVFSWQAEWIDHLLLFAHCFPPLYVLWVLFSLSDRKRLGIRVPFCDRHRNHWRNLTLLLWGCLAGTLGIGLSLVVFFFVHDRRNEDLLGHLCLAFFACLVGSVILVVVRHNSSIRLERVTNVTVTLNGVATAFKNALSLPYTPGIPGLPERREEPPWRTETD